MRQAEEAIGSEASGDEVGFCVQLLQRGPGEVWASSCSADFAPFLVGFDAQSPERFGGSSCGVGELCIVPAEDALEGLGAQDAVPEGSAHCGCGRGQEVCLVHSVWAIAGQASLVLMLSYIVWFALSIGCVL